MLYCDATLCVPRGIRVCKTCKDYSNYLCVGGLVSTLNETQKQFTVRLTAYNVAIRKEREVTK